MPDEPPKNRRDFMLVVKIGTAASMSLMAGFLFSLKQVHPAIVLRFDLASIAAAMVAGAASWRFCAILARSDASTEPGRRRLMIRWMIGFLGASTVGTLAAFAYALKDVSSSSRWDVIEGTVIAAAVLVIGGWLIYRVFKFFEEQSAIELEQQRRDHEEQEREDDEG